MPLNSTHYPELQPFSRFSYFLMLGVNKILVDFNYFKKYDKILVIVSKRKPTRPNCINIIIFSGTTKEVINDRSYRFGLVWFMVFTATYKTMSVISLRSVLLVEETRVPGETTDLSQATDIALSHNVVSSTPRYERGSNSKL